MLVRPCSHRSHQTARAGKLLRPFPSQRQRYWPVLVGLWGVNSWLGLPVCGVTGVRIWVRRRGRSKCVGLDQSVVRPGAMGVVRWNSAASTSSLLLVAVVFYVAQLSRTVHAASEYPKCNVASAPAQVLASMWWSPAQIPYIEKPVFFCFLFLLESGVPDGSTVACFRKSGLARRTSIILSFNSPFWIILANVTPVYGGRAF